MKDIASPKEFCANLHNCGVRVKNNFSLTAVAKTNIRAYFVDMRVQLLFLLVEHNLCDFETIIECFNDYTRNNRGDIGSRLRIGAMKSLQENGFFNDR